MKLARTYLLSLGLIAVIAACGSDDSADTSENAATTGSGHCTVENASGYYFCIDYSEWSTAGLEAAETACTGANWGVAGTWTGDSLCSVTAIGSCALTAGSDAYTFHYTQVPDGADVESNCTTSLGGTYTAASLTRGPDGWFSSDD